MTRDELLQKYAEIAKTKKEAAEWLKRNNFDFVAGAEFGEANAYEQIIKDLNELK